MQQHSQPEFLECFPRDQGYGKTYQWNDLKVTSDWFILELLTGVFQPEIIIGGHADD